MKKQFLLVVILGAFITQTQGAQAPLKGYENQETIEMLLGELRDLEQQDEEIKGFLQAEILENYKETLLELVRSNIRREIAINEALLGRIRQKFPYIHISSIECLFQFLRRLEAEVLESQPLDLRASLLKNSKFKSSPQPMPCPAPLYPQLAPQPMPCPAPVPSFSGPLYPVRVYSCQAPVASYDGAMSQSGSRSIQYEFSGNFINRITNNEEKYGEGQPKSGENGGLYLHNIEKILKDNKELFKEKIRTDIASGYGINDRDILTVLLRTAFPRWSDFVINRIVIYLTDLEYTINGTLKR